MREAFGVYIFGYSQFGSNDKLPPGPIEVLGIEKLFCIGPRKRFGKPFGFGRCMFAFSNFGSEDVLFSPSLFGCIDFGHDSFCCRFSLSGIYRSDNVTGVTKWYKEPYYIPKNPRTESQQAQRSKLADGVSEWFDLTPEEKDVFNERARAKHLSGYNLFLKEYLLSN